MSEEDLHTVLAHIEDDPNFARAVAADRRELLRYMRMRQPILRLTDEEQDSAIGQAILRRDHPLTPAERRNRRNAPAPQAPCAEKRRAVETARRQLQVDDPRAAAAAAAGSALVVAGAAIAPAGPGRDVAYTGAVVAVGGGVYQSVSQFVEHSRALRRAVAELQDCLYRNRLRADAERLGTTLAAIDDELAQLSTIT